MYKRVAFGAAVGHGGGHGAAHGGTHPGRIKDVNLREVVAILAFLVFVFWVGFHPMDFINIMDASVDHLLTQVSGGHALVAEVLVK